MLLKKSRAWKKRKFLKRKPNWLGIQQWRNQTQWWDPFAKLDAGSMWIWYIVSEYSIMWHKTINVLSMNCEPLVVRYQVIYGNWIKINHYFCTKQSIIQTGIVLENISKLALLIWYMNLCPRPHYFWILSMFWLYLSNTKIIYTLCLAFYIRSIWFIQFYDQE